MTALILIVLFIIIYYVSALTPWIGDDIYYGYFIKTGIWDVGGKITGIGEVLQSQCNHWLHVNGRYIAHTLIQCYCGPLGQQLFAVSNGIMYCILVLLFAKNVGIRKLFNEWRGILTISMLVLFSFVTKMMPSCQIGFIWMMVVLLLCLRIFFTGTMPKSIGARIIVVPGLVLLGIFAGNSTEGLVIGVSISLLIWAIRKRFRLSLLQWLITAGWIIGFAALFSSPAMWSRAEGVKIPLLRTLLMMAISLRSFWILIIVVLFRCLTAAGRTFVKRFIREQWFWLVSIAGYFIFAITVGVYINRQMFGIEMVSIILLIKMLPGHRFSTPYLVLMGLIVCAQTIWLVDMAKKVSNQYNTIVEKYNQSADGTVCFNRTRVSNRYLPDMRYHEETIDAGWADMSHSLGLQLKTDGKWLNIVPEGYSQSLESDTAIQYSPGHWMLFITKDRPYTIKVQSVYGAETIKPQQPQRKSLETKQGNIYTLVSADHTAYITDVEIPK